MSQRKIFTEEDMAVMTWAVALIGLAADHVQCEVCGRWWDTISPCVFCNATRGSTGRV